MSSIWSDSDWRGRLRERLEPLLKSPDLVKEISTYQGVPYALFAYPPTAERALRREARLLATRVEAESQRRVHTVSMADLIWEAVCEAFPPDGSGLFASERAHAHEPTRRRLELLREQMEQVLDEVAPLAAKIEARARGLEAERDVVFLVRVGALYPAFRASALLENLMGTVTVPTILFYPGTRSGRNSLRFMDSLDALHSYRHKIF